MLRKIEITFVDLLRDKGVTGLTDNIKAGWRVEYAESAFVIMSRRRWFWQTGVLS